MARRFQEITEVYRQEIAALARADRWTAFLRSACRNYKLPFEEQVLVHAQRPDATAVLEIERWNRQFGRWVNKGATGIAVFDRDYPGRTRLKYYFDISDTHESRLSRPVPLWQVPAEQEPDVIEALENRFGALDDKGTLEEAIVSAMENAAADNMTDYLDDLQNCRDNSLLEELDELNLSVLYRRLLENSTAYMLMCRCGLEPDEYFDPEDFSEVFNFNTPETLNALGVATRDIAESGLSAIALTVRSRQKQIRTIAQAPENEYPIDKQTETQTERSENHGTDIHDEGRLPAAGSAAAAGAGNSPWEIRPAAPEVSEGAPEGAVHEPADIGQAERASGGDRPDGAAARGTDGDGDGSGRGRDGGAESRRPDEVGGADEQPEKRRRGDSAGGADLQLNTEPEEADSAEEATSELPAFLDEKKIFAIIENRNDDLIYKKAQIELFFRSHPDEAERAEYLRSAYQDRFTEILADGARLGYRPQKNGLLMWEGAYLSRTSESVFSWKLVAGFTAQLIDKREYYVNTEIKPFVPMESQQLTLFDMPAFDQPDGTPAAPLFSHPKLPQQIIDEALCVGSNDEHSRLIICAYFMKDKPDNAAFLQKHYGENGAGFYLGGEKVSLWYDAEGMRIARGSTAQRSNVTLISWEEAAKRNAVFVGMDRNGTPRYACLRGIGTDFKGEATGSDKRFSFALPATGESRMLCVFESAIDLLSYATMAQAGGLSWRSQHLLSLAGVYKPQKETQEHRLPLALTQYLKGHAEIKTICLCLDNDMTGRSATEAIRQQLAERYEVASAFPRQGKDYNDWLCIRMGLQPAKENPMTERSSAR